MRIFILLGHPRARSYCGALADAYAQAAQAAGHDVQRQDLAALDFDANAMPDWPEYDERTGPRPQDLLESQANLSWCERFVLIYPMWAGNVPARLKSWIEQTLSPGFAFRYHDKGPGWDRLLKGREAHIVRTSDAPGLYTRLWYRDCDIMCLRRAVLGFCGIRTTKVQRIGGVGAMNEKGRAAAIEKVGGMV